MLPVLPYRRQDASTMLSMQPLLGRTARRVEQYPAVAEFSTGAAISCGQLAESPQGRRRRGR
jgi:hypothetical protein